MPVQPEMRASDLTRLLRCLNEVSLDVWLDGGWGVDALLGRQTRSHSDVDIVLRISDVPRLEQTLGRQGFSVAEGTPPHSFVLANGSGLRVDVHAVRFDDSGDGVYRMQNGEDWIYPAEGFRGAGTVEGRTVHCLSATTQVLCHAYGYTPVEKDLQDMQLLAERFGLELPPQLRRSST